MTVGVERNRLALGLSHSACSLIVCFAGSLMCEGRDLIMCCLCILKIYHRGV